MNLGTIAKALVAAGAAGIAPYTAALQPDSQSGAGISLGEGLTIAVAVLVALGAVYTADNVRWFKYAKAATAAVVVFLSALTPALLSGQTADLQLILAALLKTAVTFGFVSQVPNASDSEWHDAIGGDGEPEPVDPDEPEATALAEPVEGGPVDADGDGHDDATGQWMPKGAAGRAVRLPVPGGALALILGGAVVDPYGSVGVRA